jgi:hypothetical protein
MWLNSIEKGNKMAKKMASKENKEVEICQHNISYYYRDYEGEMPDSEQEYVKECIVNGYNQGELCFVGDDGTTEYRGWWHIER